MNEVRPLGFRTAGLKRFGLRRALAGMAEIGYRTVELCEEHPEARGLRGSLRGWAALKRAATELGLSVASFSYHGKRDPIPIRQERAAGVIRAALSSDVGVVVLGAPLKGGATEADFLRQAESLIELTGESGPVLAWEYEPGTLLGDLDDLVGFLDRWNTPAIAANLDIGHVWLTERDVIGPVRLCSDRIAHMHIEDIAGSRHVHLAPGEGDLDWAGLRFSLNEIGYKGPMVIDLFDLPHNPWQRLRTALDGARELLR